MKECKMISEESSEENETKLEEIIENNLSSNNSEDGFFQSVKQKDELQKDLKEEINEVLFQSTNVQNSAGVYLTGNITEDSSSKSSYNRTIDYLNYENYESFSEKISYLSNEIYNPMQISNNPILSQSQTFSYPKMDQKKEYHSVIEQHEQKQKEDKKRF